MTLEHGSVIVGHVRDWLLYYIMDAIYTNLAIYVKQNQNSLNAQMLNLVTKKDPYPLSSVHGCVESIRNTKIFSTLGTNRRYWQFPVHTQDKVETWFCSYKGHFQFIRIYLGIISSPPSFQRALKVMLDKWKQVIVYLFYVIVFY